MRRRARSACLTLAALVLLAAPTPSSARPLTVTIPKFDVPPLSNREVCVFLPLPSKKTMDVGEIRMLNFGNKASFITHHLIVYAYSGDPAAVEGLTGKVIDDQACLNFAGGNPSDLTIVATSQAITAREVMPKGTALRLEPDAVGKNGKQAIGLVLNSHWINATDKPQPARAKVKFLSAKKGSVKKQLKPIFEVVANGFINVRPGEVRKASFAWRPGGPNFGSFLGGVDSPSGPACVTMLISHMHRRGTLFTTTHVKADGTTEHLYTNEVYDHPPALRFDPPLLVKVGDALAYECTHDNATEPRLGCEEEAGVAPGKSVIDGVIGGGGFARPNGAAKVCRTPGDTPAECPATDPAYPTRTFTGRCVPANLVFGFTSEDDMCILPGYYYDADPAAAPGHECDL